MFNLSSKKINLFLLFTFLYLSGSAQYYLRDHDKKKLERGFSYGIALGLLESSFNVDPSIRLLEQQTIQTINGNSTLGASMGLIGNVHPSEALTFRVVPTLSFGEQTILYQLDWLDKPAQYRLESTYFEVPLYMKYKSKPYDNFRMFLIGGGRFRTNLTIEKQEELLSKTVALNKTDALLEIGAGFELHYSFFSLSPQFTISQGIKNQLVENNAINYSYTIDHLNTRVYSLVFNIE